MCAGPELTKNTLDIVVILGCIIGVRVWNEPILPTCIFIMFRLGNGTWIHVFVFLSGCCL